MNELRQKETDYPNSWT